MFNYGREKKKNIFNQVVISATRKVWQDKGLESWASIPMEDALAEFRPRGRLTLSSHNYT